MYWKLKPKTSTLDIRSYIFDRYSNNGVCDNGQLNIKNDTISKLKSVSNIYELANISMKPQSSYMDNARKLTSIREEFIPSNFDVEGNKNQLHIDITHYGANEDTFSSNEYRMKVL